MIKYGFIMKITEQQLKNIIRKTISEAMEEATAPASFSIDRATANAAQRYLNHTGGYSKFGDRFAGETAPNLLNYGTNINYANAANGVYDIIRKYTNVISRLSKIYRAITQQQSKSWTPEQKAKAAKTRAFNKSYAQQNPMGKRYSDAAANGSFDPNSKGYMGQSLAGAQTNRAVERNQRARTGQNWFGLEENVDEAFFGGQDEVDQICKNWRQYIGNQDAANKVLQRINEYKQVVGQLKAFIKKGIDTGHVVDNRRAYMKARSSAASASNGGSMQQVAESVDRAVRNAFRKILG